MDIAGLQDHQPLKDNGALLGQRIENTKHRLPVVLSIPRKGWRKSLQADEES